MEAFETQAELDKIYQDARLTKSDFNASLIELEMSERIFGNFIRQVANETNQQFGNSYHESSNSNIRKFSCFLQEDQEESTENDEQPL